MTNCRRSKDILWQIGEKPEYISRPLIGLGHCGEDKLSQICPFSKLILKKKEKEKDDQPFLLLTLYLSTIGSLTAPSVDLVKFGKLSRWEINGKPLVTKKTKKMFTSVYSFYYDSFLTLLITVSSAFP